MEKLKPDLVAGRRGLAMNDFCEKREFGQINP
jgi:hypothetical protein